MSSVGVQAEISDPEGVLGLVRSFQTQLEGLVQMNSSLVELSAARGQSIQQSESLVRDLEGRVQSLVDGAAEMEGMLHTNQHALQDRDTELEDLTNRMEHLDTEIGNLERQAKTNVSEDIDNEQRLTGFALEELYRKMDMLGELRHRLDRGHQNKQQEWDQFKSDCNKSQDEMGPYQEQTDHLDELTLARYAGMQSHKGEGSQERDLSERLSEHHWNKLQHRQHQQQLTHSQMKQQDLEDEIGALMTKKRDLWRKCLDLENCLDDLKDSTEETHPLRPSSAYADIPFVADGGFDPEGDSDEAEQETETMEHELVCHGRLLHRNPKNTNIVVRPYVSDSGSNVIAKLDMKLEDDGNQSKVELDRGTKGLCPKNTNIVVGPYVSDSGSNVSAKIDLKLEDEGGTDGPSTSEDPPDQDQQDSETMEDQSTTGEGRKTAHRIAGGEEHKSTSMVMKIRKRMGLDRHSSSIRVKNTRVTATGSSRGLTKDAFVKRRR